MLRIGAPARVMMIGAGIADKPQPGTGAYGISKAASARLMRQMVIDFDHEGSAYSPSVALFQPSLVDTEGLRAHGHAAHACNLPHANWLSDRLSQGGAQRPEVIAIAMADALLQLPRCNFHGTVLRPDDLAKFTP